MVTKGCFCLCTCLRSVCDQSSIHLFPLAKRLLWASFRNPARVSKVRRHANTRIICPYRVSGAFVFFPPGSGIGRRPLKKDDRDAKVLYTVSCLVVPARIGPSDAIKSIVSYSIIPRGGRICAANFWLRGGHEFPRLKGRVPACLSSCLPAKGKAPAGSV